MVVLFFRPSLGGINNLSKGLSSETSGAEVQGL